MNEVRVSVHQNYKELKKSWIIQDFSRILKVRNAPIDSLYKYSALLLNLHVYLYGAGQVKIQFGVNPPTLEQYLNKKHDF